MDVNVNYSKFTFKLTKTLSKIINFMNFNQKFHDFVFNLRHLIFSLSAEYSFAKIYVLCMQNNGKSKFHDGLFLNPEISETKLF